MYEQTYQDYIDTNYDSCGDEGYSVSDYAEAYTDDFMDEHRSLIEEDPTSITAEMIGEWFKLNVGMGGRFADVERVTINLILDNVNPQNSRS